MRNAPAEPALRPAPAVARVLVRAAVPAVAGLAITVAGLASTMAAAPVPARAAQYPHGPAVSRVHPTATGWHTLTAGINHGPHWTHIAGGGLHTCGIRADSTLWCWGWNDTGQLGIGNFTDEDRPRQVTTPAPGGWASVTAGSSHTCATRTNGTLWCWGYDGFGQLGVGTDVFGEELPQQVTSPALGGWASVTAGSDHTCATRTGGTLWCWGANESGELGIGNFTDEDRPRQVTSPAPEGWASVTSGSNSGHTCATRTGGTLWCWGDNFYGQLGIGLHTEQDRPQQVTTPLPGGWASVTTGENHTCATRTGGTLWCWGDDFYGQLGIGLHTERDRPQQVTIPAPGGWTSVTGGDDHTCATRTGGTLWCWGWNRFGQLGIGRDPVLDLPQQVTTPAPGGWASVTAGNLHTCATRTGGTLWCWGDNESGQLGIGNLANQSRPRQVPGCRTPRIPSPPARTSPRATRRPSGAPIGRRGPADGERGDQPLDARAVPPGVTTGPSRHQRAGAPRERPALGRPG